MTYDTWKTTNPADEFLGPQPCEWCEGTGRATFCPSEPDQCSGCEPCECSWCGGTGQEEVPEESGEPAEFELDEALAWGGIDV